MEGKMSDFKGYDYRGERKKRKRSKFFGYCLDCNKGQEFQANAEGNRECYYCKSPNVVNMSREVSLEHPAVNPKYIAPGYTSPVEKEVMKRMDIGPWEEFLYWVFPHLSPKESIFIALALTQYRFGANKINCAEIGRMMGIEETTAREFKYRIKSKMEQIYRTKMEYLSENIKQANQRVYYKYKLSSHPGSIHSLEKIKTLYEGCPSCVDINKITRYVTWLKKNNIRNWDEWKRKR
jgi:hypothetical protein